MTSFSTEPQSIHFVNISQLQAWTPQTQAFDAFNIAQVPLRPRPVVAQPLVHDCNDFNGGYVTSGDLYPQGVPTIDTYNFTFWQYLDNFCYFSHHRVSIPTTWWINAAHIHGVPVLGTIDFEGADPSTLNDFAQMMSNSTQCVQQLAALAQHYGFDGWFFNIEIDLPGGADQAQQLISLIADLRTALQRTNPQALVIWYDAVTTQGVLNYQNCLNKQNNGYFLVSDGIFPNYGWFYEQQTLIGTSVATAGKDGRSPYAVYTGVDVYARSGGEPGNTDPGNDAISAVGACVEYGTSTGVFAPGWTYGTAQGASPQPHHQNYETLDTSFWMGSGAGHNPGSSLSSDCIAKYIPERIVPGALPFASNFDRGCGTGFVVRGASGSTTQWSNLSLEGPQPTYRYWALPGSASSFNVSVSYDNSYDGGACLSIEGSNCAATDSAIYRLYDLNAPVTSATTLQVVFSPLTPSCYPTVQLGVVFSDGSSYTTLAAPVALNGWMAVSEMMTANIGKTIAQLLLHIGPSNNGQTPNGSYGVRIGAMSVAPAAMASPISVQELSAQPVYSDSSTMGALLTWNYQAGAARFFDIWRTDGAAPQWLMRVCANAAWIGGLAAVGTGCSCAFAVQPVDYSLNAQPLDSAARAELNILPLTFNDAPTIALLGNPAISAMTVMSGEIVNALQTSSGTYTLPQHGDSSGGTSAITLESGDQIVSLSGATGVWYGWNCVVQLTLKTKNGVIYGPFGTMGGVTTSTPFSYTAPVGQSLLAFSGALVNVPLASGQRVNIIQALLPTFG